jgi:argininosuccinate lyase
MSTNQLDKKSQAWSALFSEPMSDLVKRYTSSVFFDKRLWQADITGSLAHAEMLAAQGIISAEDHASIQRGMAQITADIESGNFEWKLDLEDVHLNIEARLTQLVGDAGKRLHGRSRNTRLPPRQWLRGDRPDRRLLTDGKALIRPKKTPSHLARLHPPVAQPSASATSLCGNVPATPNVFRCAAAPAPAPGRRRAGGHQPRWIRARGTTLAWLVARPPTGLPKQPDRERPRLRHRVHSCRLLCMVHISRMSEELILWMSQNFGFVKIADRFTTGSSIMPQKKNPDVPELARGKTGRVVGHLMGLITLMKGQPLAYNKDNQEDKEPLFDTVDTLKDTLRIFCEMVGGQVNPATGAKEGGITVNAQAMEDAAKKGYATATDLADYLVKKGLPFRDAHETVAHAVKAATSHNCDLSELPLHVLQGFHPAIEKDVYHCLSLRGSLEARNTLGGTAPAQVRLQIARHHARLG